MSTINMPTLQQAPYSCQFVLVPNTQTFESPLNRTVQTLELPGARWKMKFDYKNLRFDSDYRALKSFIAKLRGMSGRFYGFDYSHKTPNGSALGSGLVKDVDQSGNTLTTYNWTPNQLQCLLPGDYVGIYGELKLITETTVVDSSGEATITFEPPLRVSPPADTPIITYMPTATFMLIDDKQDQAIIDPERKPSFSFEAMEVF